ncbi:hypothetical protein [Erythrobacter sp. R86502]|uniref:hypothetical protein n=1 Tax=Erythrobacter sp. R86502 TaxID=3093846 RepID=UPI0036D35FE7
MSVNDRRTRIDETDASAGSKSGVVRWILLISLGLAIVAMTVIWMTGALSQNDVEGAGTATGRAEAQREAAAPDSSSIDGVVTDRDAATGE